MTKTDFYSQLSAQVSAIIDGERDGIANMANISALLFDALEHVNWVGFYRIINDELVLGPFQGKVACIRIPVGTGVCGSAAADAKTYRVADVHQFSGHIACDAASNSEIVIPIHIRGQVIAVLDIDSVLIDRFDSDDQRGLETIAQQFEKSLIQSGVDQL